MRADLAGSPPPLAALHAHANELIKISPAGFTRLLASLHGYAVVVNKWASWCGYCTTEFPVLQQVSARLGKRVAFIGLDAGDTPGPAHRFLAGHPVSYPSYEDPNESIADTIELAANYPMTAFFYPSGKLSFVHQGPYASSAAMLSDLHIYLND